MPVDEYYLEQMQGKRWESPIPPCCMKCGYSLVGAVSDRCPECGNFFVEKEWRQQVEKISERIDEFKDACRWAGLGLRAALVGAGLAVVAAILPTASLLAPLLRGAACIAGIGAFFLGASVFRILGVPAWARQHLQIAIPYGTAAWSVVLGLAIAAWVVLG